MCALGKTSEGGERNASRTGSVRAWRLQAIERLKRLKRQASLAVLLVSSHLWHLPRAPPRLWHAPCAPSRGLLRSLSRALDVERVRTAWKETAAGDKGRADAVEWGGEKRGREGDSFRERWLGTAGFEERARERGGKKRERRTRCGKR